jgi:hypothetical protein
MSEPRGGGGGGILTMRLILDFVLISNLYVFVFTFIVIKKLRKSKPKTEFIIIKQLHAL